MRFGHAVRVNELHAQDNIEQLALGRAIVATNKLTSFGDTKARFRHVRVRGERRPRARNARANRAPFTRHNQPSTSYSGIAQP